MQANLLTNSKPKSAKERCAETNVLYYHFIHEGNKAPEGIYFILHYKKDRREQVTHTLHVPCTGTGNRINTGQVM